MWACGGAPSADPDPNGFHYTPEMLQAFRAKVPLNALPSEGDPYPASGDGEGQVDPPERVCAIRYVDDARVQYELHTFETADEARAWGFHVTHQGHCGTCSTLADLALYIEKRDLTEPVRSCAAWSGGHHDTVQCLMKLGFTSACAETWAWNARHTRTACFSPCAWAWVEGAPSNQPDGGLNECLACDEVHSGPIFKKASGRTRRNSGLRSSIDRPADEVYPLVHDYF
jgi:hypothetical protein